MMNIYDISGDVWLSDVPLTSSCEATEELMKEDCVQLAWKSASNSVIPVGAYITLDGERYSLLEPYTPEQTSEAQWSYKPKFHSAYRALSKVPFFMYTTVGSETKKEADWVLTDNPANFMSVLCNAIFAESGLKYTYAVAGDLSVASATCSFNCVDIQSAINEIANAFETELWLEKYAQADGNGNIGCLHLGKAVFGEAVELEVGVNVKVPSVTRNGEYYNRFYVFGSARNITQDYAGADVNNVATKRLTLPATEYPGGYMDFSNGGQVFSKVLVFEDIYPSASDLVVMNIRSWLRYRRDEATSEKVQIGTDPVTGDPVYDMYAVWFVNLKRKVGGAYVDFAFNNTTYDKEDNPTGMLLPGLVPSLHFNGGPLAGREFEVIYHESAEMAKDGADGSTFQILAGDFEIKFVEEGTYIIPSVTGLVPQTDDPVVLFNVMMPGSYVEDAESRLETAALQEINRNYLDTATLAPVDRNSYQVQSDPTAFHASDPGLTLGRRVRYVNGTYEKESRVTKITKRLDPTCYQTIVFGDEIIKGSIEELKEEAVSANRNIDILAALNKTTAELTAAYERSHQLILKQLADQSSMWLVVNGAVKLNPIYAGVWAEGFVASGGVGSEGGGGGGGGGLIESVLGVADLDTPIVLEDLSETFSAKAIQTIWDAVKVLQNTTPNVSLVNGANNSTLTVNGTVADFYTKAQVDGLISGIHSFEPVPVQSLPTASADTMYKLYLVPSSDPQSQNIKDEYITVRSGSAGNYSYDWEQIGSTAIDLTGYVTLSGAQTITGGKTFSGGIVMDGADIVPSSNNTSGIGTSSARFAGIYGVNADLSGGLSLAQTGHIDIGPARIEYDATNGAIHVTTNQTGNNAPTIGFYVDEFLASGGIGNGGGGGYGVEEITSNEDGTVDFHFTGGDVTTVDLNHEHPQYASKMAETSQPSGGFLPDVVYELGTLTGAVTFALATAVSGQVNHYFWTFTAGSTAPTITWPSGITWAAGSAPTPTANKKYEISVLNGVAAYMEV